MSESLKILSAKIGSVPEKLCGCIPCISSAQHLGHEKQESAKKALLYLLKNTALLLYHFGGWFTPVFFSSVDSRLISPSLLIGDCPLASADRVVISIKRPAYPTTPTRLVAGRVPGRARGLGPRWAERQRRGAGTEGARIDRRPRIHRSRFSTESWPRKAVGRKGI